MQYVIVILIVLLAVAAIAGGIYAKRKRRELFQGIARKLGGRFHADDPFALAGSFECAFPTLRTGSRRYAFNVIAAEWQGTPVRIFDHHYETYSHSKNGRQTHHHYRTFALIEHDVDLGQLDVRPEGMFDKMKAAFGFDDIDFESDEFSRKWHVGAQDRKFAYDLFHPKMIEYFLTLSGFKLSTNGTWGLYRIGSGRMSHEEILRTLAAVHGMVDRIPRYLKKDRTA